MPAWVIAAIAGAQRHGSDFMDYDLQPGKLPPDAVPDRFDGVVHMTMGEVEEDRSWSFLKPGPQNGDQPLGLFRTAARIDHGQLLRAAQNIGIGRSQSPASGPRDRLQPDGSPQFSAIAGFP